MLTVCAAIGAARLSAQVAERGGVVGNVLPREVVVLVGSAVEDIEAPRQDPARAVLQMPLNHLGLRLVRYGTDAAEPPDLDPARVLAVGTWFEANEQLPSWVWPWLERQASTLRTLHFGSLLPLARGDGGDRLRRHLLRFGLGYDDAILVDPAKIEVEYVRHEHVPFESKPVYERVHLGPWTQDEHNHVWLATRDRERPRRARAPVVTGPWGGIALQPWFLRMGGSADDRRFYVDPFAFLGEALQQDGLPVPEPNLRFGRRVFLLHVDGDGFESRSTVGDGHLCGEVFKERIVDRWQVPMTISFIVAGLTEHLTPSEPTPRMLLAREILSRPWVEAASHSVLHPLDWRKHLTSHSLARSVVWYGQLDGYTHDMAGEVRESIAFIDRWLVPAGKRCRVMLWSGASNPTEAALAAASDAGCWNLNGGLFRWDELHDSVGFVSPWGATIGAQFQVFVGAPNENVFDGYFTTMPGAFKHVDRTIENTGRGRILKPANVYVHFYAAEQPARLAALEYLLERWLDREPVLPTFASTYAAAVDDCERRCTIARTPTGFRLAGFENCRTVRFDGPRLPVIDWQLSKGLAGARQIGDRLFVHLAGAAAELRFVEAAAGQPVTQPVTQPVAQPASLQPYVEEADCELTDVQMVAGELALTVPTSTLRQRLVVVAGLPAHRRLEVQGLPVAAMAPGAAPLRSDGAGRCELRLPPGPAVALRISTVGGER